MDSEQKLHQAINVLPAEREKLLVSYCNMLSVDMDSAGVFKNYLLEFAQLLTDYSALVQFELVECVVSRERATGGGNQEIQRLVNLLQQSTDRYLVFIDRYQPAEQAHDLHELCADLESLGVSLAERFDIEDALVRNCLS